MFLCGLQSPGLCHPIVLQELTEVSDGSNASIFRVEAKNRREAYFSVLKMKTASSSDTSTKIYGVKSQKTGNFQLTTTKTSNLSCTNLSFITNRHLIICAYRSYESFYTSA